MPHIIYSWIDCDINSNMIEKPLFKMFQNIPNLDKYMSFTNIFVVDERKTTFRNNTNNVILIPP